MRSLLRSPLVLRRDFGTFPLNVDKDFGQAQFEVVVGDLFFSFFFFFLLTSGKLHSFVFI